MKRKRISGILTSKVGRRILGFFFLAGVLPVMVTAYLAYLEVGRGLEQNVSRQLREYSKAYGNEILARLTRATGKGKELVRIIESEGADALENHRYLIDDFDAVWFRSAGQADRLLFGDRQTQPMDFRTNYARLDSGQAQLVIDRGDSGARAMLLVPGRRASESELIASYAFELTSNKFWDLGASAPFSTDFCVFSEAGAQLYCSGETNTIVPATQSIRLGQRQKHPAIWTADGKEYLGAGWQLFLSGQFDHAPVNLLALQSKTYALRSGSDFRRVFPPALALVIVLVGALSFSLIGQSLVPLKRLTQFAGQLASGHLGSRVSIKTEDEFESLGEVFNDMASRLGRRIDTMKAMSSVDRLILAGAKIEEVSESLIANLIELTGYEVAAVISRDTNAPVCAKMISWSDGRYSYDRLSLPQELGNEWCQPRQVTIAHVDADKAPYRDRFQEFGIKYTLLIPVIWNKELKGVLLLGSNSKFDMSDGRLKLCIDLAGRLAVALSSVEREDALYRQAHFDELTGLPNRQLLKDRLEQHLAHAQRGNHDGAMLYIDLDRFKEINDIFGHSVGDIVLAQTAERILAEVRDSDTVARLGGDEFVIVMPVVDENNMIRVTAERILTRLSEAFCIHGTDHYLGASIGIVVYPEDGGSVETLLKNADAAMYRAKDAGRSRFEFFNRELNAESRRKIEMERDLRKAFEARELKLHYQPQFDLSTGMICGAEALLRWEHRKLGGISPAEFIPLAEESDLIVDIGKWVIEQCCLDLRKILNRGFHPGSMSVNVSARQLREASFADETFDTLQRHGIHTGYLQLEITETTVAQNRDTAIAILHRMRQTGVQIAIDDFGTGYSSLSYLQQLPFDHIKIDKSFIDMLGTDENSESICRTIVTMAHEMGKKALAEGVETREQADFLGKIRCDSVQGYYYSEPLPQEKFLEFIEQQDFHTQRRKALEIIGT